MTNQLFTLAAAFLLCVPGWRADARIYYVATNGVDTNPGTLAQPLLTIQKAASMAVAGDTVSIRGGMYRETVAPANSGSCEAPINYQSYGSEVATIDGANVIGANTWSVCSNHIWQAPMAWDLGGGNQVFVDGEMMNEARFPHSTLEVTHPEKLLVSAAAVLGSGRQAIGSITNASLDQPAGYWVGASVTIALGKVWVNETLPIIASGPGWIRFPFQKGEDYTPLKGDPFFLTGKRSELAAPGEWFYDAAGRKLWLWPPAGDRPSQHTVEAKARQFAFDLRGRSYINIRRVQLFAATIVTDEVSSHLVLDGLNACYVSHFSRLVRWKTGAVDSGIILDGSENTLQNSTLAFSAGNGVALLGNGNVVSNNIIHDIDYSGGVGAGVNTGGGCRKAVISHNTIFKSGHRLIDMGHLGAGLIEYNDLFYGGIQMTDFGGIYAANSDGAGTRICYNCIHDCNGPSNGLNYDNNSKGIYLDNGSSNYIVDHNVVWNVDKALVLNSREGTSEMNRNNLVLNNTLAGTSWSYGWKHCPSPGTLVANNIFLAKAEPSVSASVSHNLFPNTDPRFVPGSRFELRADSPARSAGLERVPYAVATSGGGPDLGAFAYGILPWSAGSSLLNSPKPMKAKVNFSADTPPESWSDR